jgi:sRNA-binding carbon storage regulator CsrA
LSEEKAKGHLILSRRRGERIVIGEGEGQVVLTVLGFYHGGAVRIGFESARGTRILRAELLEGEGVRRD